MLFSLIIVGLVLIFSAFVVVFTVKVLLSVILWKSSADEPSASTFKVVNLKKTKPTKEEIAEKERNRKNKERDAIIDANVEMYDGTEIGQVDVPDEV